MPVVGTPISTSGGSPGPVTCSSLVSVQPQTPTLYGCPVVRPTVAMQINQGEQKDVVWVLQDENGNPIDLSSCGEFPYPPEPLPGVDAGVTGELDPDTDYSRVQLRMVETVIIPAFADDTKPDVTGEVTDAAGGQITFTMPAGYSEHPGVYWGNVAVFGSSGRLIQTKPFQMIINRSLFGTTLRYGPPTVAEIRLHLRDSHAVENTLLDNVQWSNDEIAHAIEQPVLYWNEAQPPINVYYTTASYPYRFHWLEAIVSLLLRIASYWYMRNSMPYSSAGVQVDDLNKAAEYKKVSDELWERYTNWVLRKKVQLNADSCIQSPWNEYIPGYGGYGWGW